MADKLTVFQKLQKVLSSGSSQKNYITNHIDVVSKPNPNDVIATANSQEEYEKKLLQARQQLMLGKQWVKASYDVSNQALAGLNDVKLMYRDADLMDGFPEFGAALDVVMEESCWTNDAGVMVGINSRSERVKNILEDLFVNRLSIHTMLPMICRGMCKYGNSFMLLNIDNKNGVLGWKQLPVYEMERWENGQNSPYATPISNLNTVDEKADMDTKFVWVGQEQYIPYRNWQIAHFRLLYDSQFLPYGCLVGDTRIETETGYKELSEIEIGDKVWSFNVDSHERELAEVTMKMNKGVKETYLLETKHYYIEGTSDHKILVVNGGDLKYKEIGELTTKDLIVCNNSEKKECEYFIPIDKTAPKEYDGVKQRLNWWNDYIGNVSDYVTRDFAELFGFLMGDGWISHGCHVMFALGEHKTINDKYISILQKYTGKEVGFVKNTNKERKLEFHTAFVGSKMFATILKRMGFEGNVYTKRIPNWVFESEAEIKQAFLNGIIDADGSLRIASNKLCYCIELANEQLIKDIKTLAQSLGYRVGKIGKRNRVGYLSQTITSKPIIAQHESFYIYFYQEKNKVLKVNDKIAWKKEGLILEKVKRITPTGEKTTYDITIGNENSNFFANGIVTHNCSFFNKARRHFRMLSMMEDMMMIYRLDRSIERRVFKINVGAIDEADVQAYVQEIANNFKRKPIVDPMTGQIDLRKSFMNVTEDFFIPVRGDNTSSPIETLQGAQNLTAMDDIKFVQNKILTALRVPRSFINFEETSGDGKNLSLQDVRFTRTVNRIQQALLLELNKIAIIHLYLNGFQDELNNFTLTMNNPSSQAEMLELENLAKKITTAKDAVSDPGNGMPLTSCKWAWKHIFKWSDKEIKQNLEDMRLETALGAELQNTMQIIKRTGLFDTVDNVYGEPGAEYSEDGQGEGNESGAEGGGGGAPSLGGGFDFGSSPDEMGGGEEMGTEGEMDMPTAAEEEGAMGGEETAEGAPNISDSLLRNMHKKVLNEQSKIKDDLLKRSKHYADIFEERLLKYNEDKENKIKNIPIYDKAFFLNEEMNCLKEQLEKVEKKETTND